MSIFVNLFKKKPVIAADDPVFGRITFEQGIWAFIPKSPTEGFMITVDASESGRSQLQRDVFQKIRASLSDFELRARDFMRTRVEPGVEVADLSVYSVEVGSNDESRRQRFVLEMSDSEAIVIHRVSFCGSEAIDYGYDT
ncbi:MAG: hypothetical protein U1F77_01455 [Kiritimatiellia bacterium]